MQRIIILFVVLFVCSGCVRKMPIEQGNVIKPEMTDRLHVGMTSWEVRDIMGSPVLLNTFSENRMDYIYTFNPGRGPVEEKKVVLEFQGDKLVAIH